MSDGPEESVEVIDLPDEPEDPRDAASRKRIEAEIDRLRELQTQRDTFAYWRDRWAALDNDALERAFEADLRDVAAEQRLPETMPDQLAAYLKARLGSTTAAWKRRVEVGLFGRVGRRIRDREQRPFETQQVSRVDFHADLENGDYIFIPTRSSWPSKSVNTTLGPIEDLPASVWLDQNAPIHCKTWHPGSDEVIRDRIVSGGGWTPRRGLRTFNLYQPPVLERGDATKAGPWRAHLRKLYPDDADHIERFFAQRVQCPGVKVNHGLVLLGDQGIGKDTLIEPLKQAVGPWNFHEVAPPMLLGAFNGYIKSVVLRVSEARDMGDVNRYALYEHMKTLLAAPPDTLRCNEKHTKEYAVFNVSGVIITTNHRARGIYLPADDRRHYVAGTTITKADFAPDYWPRLWAWYADGGIGHVAAFLATLDLSEFDEKAPPPKTRWWYAIVEENRGANEDQFGEVLETLGHPAALTVSMLKHAASPELRQWLDDRGNLKSIGPALIDAGYMAVRNPNAKDGKWRAGDKKHSVYALAAMSDRDQVLAARDLLASGIPDLF